MAALFPSVQGTNTGMITNATRSANWFRLACRSAGSSAFLLLILCAAGCSNDRPSASTTAQPARATASPALENGWTLSLKTVPDHPRMVRTTVFTLHIADNRGMPIQNAHVSGVLNMTLMDMGATEAKFEPAGHGDYETSVKGFDMSGPWELSVDATQGTVRRHQVFQLAVVD